MSRAKRVARYGVVCAGSVLIGACGDSGDKSKGGSRDLGSEEAVDPKVAAAAASDAALECGEDCAADVAAGRAALAKADFAGALAAYKCADTPEAAFGAALATLLGSVEGERADRVLEDLGLPHFPGSDVFGTKGYLGRQGARYNGQGMLEITGSISAQVALDRVYAEDDYLSGETADAIIRGDLGIEGFSGLPEGTLPIQYDCAEAAEFGFGSQIGDLPYLDFALEDTSAGRIYECNIPYDVDAEKCDADHGALEIVAAGTLAGDKVEIQFRDVELSCYVLDLDWNEIDDALTIRVNGSVRATLSQEPNADDLHPLFNEDDNELSARVPAKAKASAFLAHAAALTVDLAQASCFFDRAAQGKGTVFTMPGALIGGDDVPFNAGDAKLLASAATLSASAMQLGAAYDIDLPLKDLVCLAADSFDEQDSGCGSGSQHASAFNAAFAEATVRSDRLAAARVLLSTGIERFQGAVPLADSMSLLPRNAQTEAGWTAMLEVADALEQSLSDGDTSFPFVSPAVRLDLQELFDSPVSPSDLTGEVLLYESDCDEGECYTDLDFNEDYLTRLWPALGIDFSGDYDSDESWDDMERAVEELEVSVERKTTVYGAW